MVGLIREVENGDHVTDESDPRPPCIVCSHDLQTTELQTCLRCVGRVRADLFAIVDACALLPEVLARVASNAPRDRSAGAEQAFPGGDALVMLAGGSAAAERRRAYLAGRDDDWDQDDRADDPTSVAYELGRWEDDWRHIRGEPAAVEIMTVAGAVRYLNPRIGWAASWHMAFDEFAADLSTLRYQIQVVTATDDRPVRAPVACFDCGQPTLVREYGDCGLEDDWHCRTCKRPYDQAAYWLAVRAKLEDQAS